MTMEDFINDSIELLRQNGITVHKGIMRCPKCKDVFKEANVRKHAIEFRCANSHGWVFEFA